MGSLAAISIAVVLLAQGEAQPAQEPSFHGKPLSHWLAALRDKTQPDHTHSAVALRKIGAPAVPGLIEALANKDPQVRLGAGMAFHGMSPAPKAAVGALVKALDDTDPYVKLVVAHTLSAMGPDGKPAVPVFVRWLEGSDPKERYSAISLLGELGPAAKSAAPTLRKQLDSEDRFARTLAAEALKKIEG